MYNIHYAIKERGVKSLYIFEKAIIFILFMYIFIFMNLNLVA